MKKHIIKLLIFTFISLQTLTPLSGVGLTLSPAQAGESQTYDDRWNQLVKDYQNRKETGSNQSAEIPSQEKQPLITPTISDDQLVFQGDWLALTKKYDNKYASKSVEEEPSALNLASWWSHLGDETLTELIYHSLNNNKDMASARAKVREARASVGSAKSALLPWFDSSNSWTNSDPSDNYTGGGNSNLYRLGVDASWEIDVFGRQRENVKASTATLQAQYASLHASWVSLSAEVAMNYVTLRTLQERLYIAEQNLKLQEDTLQLLQSQVDAGLKDALALNQAKYTTEQTRAAIPPIKASIEETMNTLAILIGEVPGSLEELLVERKPIPKADSVNMIGIPAEALRQRPDIYAAERQLIAQISRKKSAEKDYLPKFTLGGSIGLESLSSGSLFSSDSYGFSFGPRITIPIFHGGAIRQNIRVQTAREEQYLAAYEKSVLSAVAEVRNALTASAQEMERNKALQNGVTAAESALEIANDKYSTGLTDFNNVINAQQTLYSLGDQFATSEGQKTSNVIALFKALGGGWEPLMEEDFTK